MLTFFHFYVSPQDCEFPPVIAHGQCKIVSKLFAFEQQAVYECDEGYILIGANRLSCAFSGWSPGAPQCKTWCVKPEIEYGKLSVEKVRYVEPERITIQCESGYSMVGSEIITCSEDRTWYPEAPKCEWEYPEYCEKVVTGRKLLQCLSRPVEVKLALEVYKLSLETGQELQLLELQLEKPNNAS
ncbi:C4b-binding protein alpha chain-like [Ovis aries]|uniref:C4b-binding protein alpha chain-like n=1 Tax=Ovis aries TaxID=9940 RepID=UPI001C2F08FD|nr:C4b-binding protein alpha chain-like [Ovis aries]